MAEANYTDGILGITIDVFKTTTTTSKEDPFVLSYLAWLPFNPFVQSYLGKTVHTVAHSTVSFQMIIDPLVAQRPAYRVADEINIGAPRDVYDDSKFTPFAAYKAQYDQAVSKFKKDLADLDDLNNAVAFYSKGRKPEDKKTSTYPKHIPFDQFDWEGKDFMCPICWEEKRNKHMAVWGCYHVSCDACNRQHGTQQCSYCRAFSGVLRTPVPSPEPSFDEEIKDEENMPHAEDFIEIPNTAATKKRVAQLKLLDAEALAKMVVRLELGRSDPPDVPQAMIKADRMSNDAVSIDELGRFLGSALSVAA